MGRRGKQVDLSRDKQRVNLDMKTKDLVRLDSLKDKTGAGSRAAVFVQALRLYEWMINEVADSDKDIFIKDGDSLVKVKIFGGQ